VIVRIKSEQLNPT